MVPLPHKAMRPRRLVRDPFTVRAGEIPVLASAPLDSNQGDAQNDSKDLSCQLSAHRESKETL